MAAFDWEMLGVAPSGMDLGYYLAVNSGRLARSKEQVAARYRQLLESGLTAPLADTVWERLLSVGLLYAAVNLLWSKALGLGTGNARAEAEFGWWVEQLERRW